VGAAIDSLLENFRIGEAGRGLHFVGRSRKDPIRAGTKKCKTLLTLFIERKDIDEISF
jgi:hypothetical protein